MMCSDAGLHPDHAGWHVGKSHRDLRTRPLLSQDHVAPRGEADNVERVLPDIDADYGDFRGQLLRHDVLLCPDTPLEYRRLEHGRTIPKAAIG
jgi:hypothetical protein